MPPTPAIPSVPSPDTDAINGPLLMYQVGEVYKRLAEVDEHSKARFNDIESKLDATKDKLDATSVTVGILHSAETYRAARETQANTQRTTLQNAKFGAWLTVVAAAIGVLIENTIHTFFGTRP